MGKIVLIRNNVVSSEEQEKIYILSSPSHFELTQPDCPKMITADATNLQNWYTKSYKT